MLGHLSRLDQQCYYCQQHTSKGSILHDHPLETMGAHVSHAQCSSYQQSKSSRPPKLSIQKMHDPAFHRLLVYLILTLIVSIQMVPFLVNLSVTGRHQLSTPTRQDQSFNVFWRQTKQAFLIRGLLHFLGQLFNHLLKVLRVRLCGSDFEIGCNHFSDIGEIDQIAKDVQNGSLKKHSAHPIAHDGNDS